MPPLALVAAPAEAEAVEEAKVWLNEMSLEATRDALRGLLDGPAAVLVARAVAHRRVEDGGSAESEGGGCAGSGCAALSAGEATTVARGDEKIHSVGCSEDRPSQSLQERTSASCEGDDASGTDGGAVARVEENEMQMAARTAEEYVAKVESPKQRVKAQQLAASTENQSLAAASAEPSPQGSAPSNDNDMISTAEDTSTAKAATETTAPSISSNGDSSSDVPDRTLQPSPTEHSEAEEGSAAQRRQAEPAARPAANASMSDERLRQLLSVYHHGSTSKARGIRAALLGALASEGWQQRAKGGSGQSQSVVWGCSGGSYYFPPGVTRDNGALSRSTLEKDCPVPAGKRAYYQSLGGVVRYLRQISWHGWTAAYHVARASSDEEKRERDEEEEDCGGVEGASDCNQQQLRPNGSRDDQLCQLLRDYSDGRTARSPGGLDVRRKLWAALESEGWRKEERPATGSGGGQVLYFPPGVTKANGRCVVTPTKQAIELASAQCYFQNMPPVVWYLRSTNWHGCTQKKESAAEGIAGGKRRRVQTSSYDPQRENNRAQHAEVCRPQARNCDGSEITDADRNDQLLCQANISLVRARKQSGQPSSMFRGVSLDKHRGRWKLHGELVVGQDQSTFLDESDAGRKWDSYARKRRGAAAHGGRLGTFYVWLNFPTEEEEVAVPIDARKKRDERKRKLEAQIQFADELRAKFMQHWRSGAVSEFTTATKACSSSATDTAAATSGQKRQHPENRQYRVGDRVSVKFSRPSGWFNGSVTHELGGSSYRIDFDDGESWDIDARKRSILFEHEAKGSDDENAAVDLPSSEFVVSLVHGCGICSTEFGEKEPDSVVCQLDCGHAFCAECITTWFGSADMNTCPHCRRLFKTGLRTCPRATVAAIRRARQTHTELTGSGTAGGGQPAARPLDRGSSRTWTEEEDRDVLRMVDESGPGDWHSKATQLGTGRSGGATYNRWRKLGGAYPNEPTGTKRPRAIGHTHWTEQEDTIVVSLVRQHGTDWESIAKELGAQCPQGRAPSAIRKRWQHVLAPLNQDMPCTSTCDECGSLHNGTFGPGRFCNQSCSHAYSIRLKMERFYRENAATEDSASLSDTNGLSYDQSSEEEDEEDEPRRKRQRVAWTEEEDRKLTQLVQKEGANDWNSKATQLGTGRSAGSVSVRWGRLQRKAAVSISPPPEKEQETEPMIMSLAWKAEDDDDSDATEEEDEATARSAANAAGQSTVTGATWKDAAEALVARRRAEGAAASSPYIGVSWSKEARKWVAQITQSSQVTNLGGFSSEEEAARAYDAKARAVRGTAAHGGGSSGSKVYALNFPMTELEQRATVT